MNENLVQRVNDLPLCEDTDNIEVLLGIGSDGKTYRINKGDIKGGVEMVDIPLTGKYYKDNTQENVGVSALNYSYGGISTYIMTLNNETVELLKTGGTIHFILNDGMKTHDISYDISNSKKAWFDILIKKDIYGDYVGGYGMVFFNLDLDNESLFKLNPILPICGQNCFMIQMALETYFDDGGVDPSSIDNNVRASELVEQNYIDITDEETISQMFAEIPDVNNVIGIYFEPKPIVNTYITKEIDYSNILYRPV